MSETLAVPLGLLLESLSRQGQDRLRLLSPEAAFAAVFLGAGVAVGSENPEGLGTEHLERGESPAMAIGGYRLWAERGNSERVVPPGWEAGMHRLAKRDALPADRQTFAFRPYELIGIAAGSVAVRTKSEWLRKVVGALAADEILTTRQHLLTCFASSLLGVVLSPATVLDVTKAELGELALALWVASRFEVKVRFDGVASPDEARVVLLKRALAESCQGATGAEALVLASLLREVTGSAVEKLASSAGPVGLRTSAAVAEVVMMCRRFDLVARQFRKRHDGRSTIEMVDEYDVQDLLHGLLLTRFEDVRPEEWTPSYGGRSARTDFLLSREEVFVEAKKTRASLRDREVAEQLSGDVAFYKQHPRCRALVCFVYDPDRLLRNPAALEGDLSGVRDGVNVQLIVCPKGV